MNADMRAKEQLVEIPRFLTETKKACECTSWVRIRRKFDMYVHMGNHVDSAVWVGGINVIVISVKMKFMDHPTKNTE